MELQIDVNFNQKKVKKYGKVVTRHQGRSIEYYLSSLKNKD